MEFSCQEKLIIHSDSLTFCGKLNDFLDFSGSVVLVTWKLKRFDMEKDFLQCLNQIDPCDVICGNNVIFEWPLKILEFHKI